MDPRVNCVTGCESKECDNEVKGSIEIISVFVILCIYIYDGRSVSR